MTAEAFDAYVTGRDITYRTTTNRNYGIERYLPGQRVMWSDANGLCKYGVWFESKGNICFRYDGATARTCWVMSDGPNGLIAVRKTRPNTLVLYENHKTNEPLICRDLSS